MGIVRGKANIHGKPSLLNSFNQCSLNKFIHCFVSIIENYCQEKEELGVRSRVTIAWPNTHPSERTMPILSSKSKMVHTRNPSFQVVYLRLFL